MRRMNSSSSSFNRAMAILSGSGKSNDMVACNLYISAGKPHHQQILAQVLESSQDLCRQLRTSTGTAAGTSSCCSSYSTTDTSTTDTNVSGETNDKDEDWPSCRIAIVHAYADGPYDRSSLHLAGRAELVAKVVSHMAITAIDLLSTFHLDTDNDNDDDDDNDNDNDDVGGTDGIGNACTTTTTTTSTTTSKHPMVGLVDHISIMPLQPHSRANEQLQSKNHDSHDHGKIEHDDDSKLNANNDNDNDNDNDGIHQYIPPDANGLAALAIAHDLSQKGVNCFPYGTADRHHTPLAIVRKQKTDFFQSGGAGADAANDASESAPLPLPLPLRVPLPLGICTIGSPSNFVENFNIRLTDHISKKQAMTLTKKLRERGGHGHAGVLGVEALTLPYSLNRYEVACNLLRPDLSNGNSDSILEKVEEWVKEQVKEQEQQECQRDSSGEVADNEYTYFIDEAYRVGTTMDQCRDVMGLVNEDMVRKHDALVLERFRNFLT